MSKQLYKTFHDRPINEGEKYYGIMSNGEIISLIADNTKPDEKRIITRFLSKLGATKFIKNGKLSKMKEEPKVKEAVKKAPLTLLQKLEACKDLKDAKELAKELKWRVSSSGTIISISNNTGTIVSLTATIAAGPISCGGREHGSHNFSFNTTLFAGIDFLTLEPIAMLLAEEYDRTLPEVLTGKGMMTFIKTHNLFSNPSARWGRVMANSKYMIFTSRFKNSSGALLDMYTTNEVYGLLFKP